jgi:hypothetical protein
MILASQADNPAPALPAQMGAERPCSKCAGELDTAGYPLWCKKCRAANKREYEATKKEMQESRGYAAGVSAMRDYLVKQFAGFGGSGDFSGNDVAKMIQTCRGPFDPPAKTTA